MTELHRYADAAMYRAEPMNDVADGPRVYLLNMTRDPLGAIAAPCKMYEGGVMRSLQDVTDDDRRRYFEQVQRTHLQAPFEFVDFHFLIEGVTRAFTHQMVRQRTACFAQESLRFAVKEDAAEAVQLPPSINSTTGEGTNAFGHPEWQYLPDAEKQRIIWDMAVRNVGDAYNQLINMGMPAEDARGLLPHSITTRLHYKTNLRNLLEHAGNRLCTQAQFEWRLVWIQIVQAIRNYNRDVLKGNAADDWQYEKLSTIFKPICYLTGKCEFRADFDRACSIRPRVDAFHANGVPSSAWDVPYYDGAAVHVQPIRTAEWMLDPAAARS